jgi:hypothetical protein
LGKKELSFNEQQDLPMARSAFRVRILIRFEISPDSVGSLDPDSDPVPKAKIPRKTKRNFILKSSLWAGMTEIRLIPSYVLTFVHVPSVADPDLDCIRVQEGKIDPQK